MSLTNNYCKSGNVRMEFNFANFAVFKKLRNLILESA